MQIPVPGAADSGVKGGAQEPAFYTSIPSDSDAVILRESSLENHLIGCCDPLQPAQ